MKLSERMAQMGWIIRKMDNTYVAVSLTQREYKFSVLTQSWDKNPETELTLQETISQFDWNWEMIDGANMYRAMKNSAIYISIALKQLKLTSEEKNLLRFWFKIPERAEF